MTDIRPISIKKKSKETAMIWDRWEENGVNVSEKICNLIIKEGELEQRAQLYGQLTPAEALCASGNINNDSSNNNDADRIMEELFGFLPKAHEPLTNDHLKKLVTDQQVLTLHNSLISNWRKVREFFDVETKRDDDWNITYQKVRKPILSLEKKPSYEELLRKAYALRPEEIPKLKELEEIFLTAPFDQVNKIKQDVVSVDQLYEMRKLPTRSLVARSWAREIIIKNRSDSNHNHNSTNTNNSSSSSSSRAAALEHQPQREKNDEEENHQINYLNDQHVMA